MKILVLSDSHGSDEKIIQAVHREQDADAIVFLGDGERDFQYALAEFGFFPYGSDASRIIRQVRGNCDVFSSEPVTIVDSFEGIRVLMTHGFDQNVKYGCHRLLGEARRKDCALALFGHTHVFCLEEHDGVLLFNPGSIRSGRYGIVRIKDHKICCEERNL